MKPSVARARRLHAARDVASQGAALTATAPAPATGRAAVRGRRRVTTRGGANATVCDDRASRAIRLEVNAALPAER